MVISTDAEKTFYKTQHAKDKDQFWFPPCDGMGREVGAGFRIENTCTPVADSC